MEFENTPPSKNFRYRVFFGARLHGTQSRADREMRIHEVLVWASGIRVHPSCGRSRQMPPYVVTASMSSLVVTQGSSRDPSCVPVPLLRPLEKGGSTESRAQGPGPLRTAPVEPLCFFS